MTDNMQSIDHKKLPHWGGWDGKLAEAPSEVERLRALLLKAKSHMEHDHWCPATDGDKCTCGLIETIKTIDEVLK